MSQRICGIALLVASVLLVSTPAHACHKKSGFLNIPTFSPTNVHQHYRTTVTTPVIYRDRKKHARLAAIAEWERRARGKMTEIERQGYEFQPGDKDIFWKKSKHKKRRCKKVNLRTTQNPVPGKFFCQVSAMICQGGLPVQK